MNSTDGERGLSLTECEGAAMNSTKDVQRIRYSFLRIMTGSDLSVRRLPLMEIRSINEGPMVWLTACAHGDEVGGVVIIQEIFKRLRKSPLLRGSVCAFPMMNPLGFELASRNITPSMEDLNRSFPGNRAGSFAERIADLIFSTIIASNPALVLDLHNDWRQSIPYALIDPYPGLSHIEAYERAKTIGLKSGFVLISEHKDSPDSIGWERTLSGSLIKHGIPALTLELGESCVVNEENVRYGVSSIWNILADKGMVNDEGESSVFRLPLQFNDRILRYSHQPVCPVSGIVRFSVKPGDVVRRGQTVARIYGVFGRLQATIPAQEKAIVLGISDSSVAFPGVPIIAFGMLQA
ncbi:MAG: succinylglutamate desuccinylase/aspartoacylase family protein [Candidatus Eremiobacteraeota bacterium]|nr:succinylglutamate desuccinylase/aspartoacylase family protein [Candidatus Eremiobacteraeota bacterium]